MKNTAPRFAGALAAAALLTLAGCAWLDGIGGGRGGGGGVPACTSSVCNLVVTVSDCSISVDKPVLHIHRGNNQPRIHWTLRSAQPSSPVSFAPSGIFFKPPTNGQFVNVSGSGPTFEATDLNTVPGQYPYGITVSQGGQVCPTLDPIIMNE